MTAVVVETNVLVVANRQCEHADARCEAACLDFIEKVRACEGHRVLVDDGYRILGEYGACLDPRRQPGVGFAFFKWLHQRRGTERCHLVHITPVTGSVEDYGECRCHPDLARLDPSDRKFAAVALASGYRPDIINAVDSDWEGAVEAALWSLGIKVVFLCPHVSSTNRTGRA